MTTISLDELERRGLNIADVARESEIPYARLWRSATGGLMKGLRPPEVQRLNEVLARHAPTRDAAIV
jgi:hypothetical protein